jgi:hypothetical protein
MQPDAHWTPEIRDARIGRYARAGEHHDPVGTAYQGTRHLQVSARQARHGLTHTPKGSL